MAKSTKGKASQMKGLLTKSQALQRKMRAAAKAEKAAQKVVVSGRVGARTIDEINCDPRASTSELKHLAKVFPEDALRHPGCPLEIWWSLAERYPNEAQVSPAGQVFIPEDPERWGEIEKHQREQEMDDPARWVSHYSQVLGDRKARLFAADCAMHVLPIFELARPTDKGPRRAIDAARKFADDRLSSTELYAAHLEARSSASKFHSRESPAFYAAKAASTASERSHVLQACKEAVKAAHIDDMERDWQWDRLQEYLEGAPMYSRIGRKASTKSKK
jgi:hypothetical protein